MQANCVLGMGKPSNESNKTISKAGCSVTHRILLLANWIQVLCCSIGAYMVYSGQYLLSTNGCSLDKVKEFCTAAE